MVATDGERELVWSRAALRDAAESGWPYLELFHVAAARAERRERALFVGCGGAVAVHQFSRVYPGIRSDVVEREAGVVALAREFFGLDTIAGLTVHVADGAEFIEQAPPESWDVIVIDAYDAADMDAPFSTRGCFAAVRRALRPGGSMALNVIGTLSQHGAVARVVRAAERELDDIRILPVTKLREDLSQEALRNVVLVAVRPR